MKKLFTISGIFALLLFSQNAFAQEKQSDDRIENRIEYEGDTINRNAKEHIITLNGNVKLKTKNIALENAEKVTIDEKSNIITIYKPKDYKILSAKSIHKTATADEKNKIVYNYKDETITL